MLSVLDLGGNCGLAANVLAAVYPNVRWGGLMGERGREEGGAQGAGVGWQLELCSWRCGCRCG